MEMLTALMVSMLALAGYQYVGQSMDHEKYPPIGRMIDVGGYKLHAIDSSFDKSMTDKHSEGGPIVVIDPGMGCNSLSWGLVYPQIAKFTRVVVVDRAGYAWSDKSPLPRTSENIVKEMHALLKNGNIPGPYILVGHSFGGINVRLYASKYPQDVAGVILVDSSHEDQVEKLSFYPKAPEKSSLSKWKSYIEQSLGLHSYDAKIEQKMADAIVAYPQDVRRNFIPCLLSYPFHQTRQIEKANFELSLQQLKTADGMLGNIPLTVISRGEELKKDNLVTQEQADRKNKVWSALQADLATKSSRGKQIIAENSGHMVNVEQPDIIIDAVREMVNELRNTKE